MSSAHKSLPSRRTAGGFTLIELAIAILVIALLLGGALMTLDAQNDLRNTSETQKSLEQAREALIGFAIANGRLPCPALGTFPPSGADEGIEARTGTNCTAPGTLAQYLPAKTLGLSPADSRGFLVDAWGNPIRYVVTTWNSASPFTDAVFTSSDDNKKFKAFVQAQGFPTVNHLIVCARITKNSPLGCDPPDQLVNTALAVMFSMGKNFALGPQSLEESANVNNLVADNNHLYFAQQTPSPNYDDIVIWLSPYTLYNRMIAAGAL